MEDNIKKALEWWSYIPILKQMDLQEIYFGTANLLKNLTNENIFYVWEKENKTLNLLDELKEYFATTPREKVLEDWAKSVEFDNVGPTVEEFLKPQEYKYVWFDMNSGKFSNSWDEEAQLKWMDGETLETSKANNMKLIKYKCINDSEFEFYNQMKLR